MRCRVTDLRLKEVVNIKDGTILGCVDDVEVDVETARILAIVVFGRKRFFGLFGRCDDIVIEWRNIEVIGDDAVLVCLKDFIRPEKRRGGFMRMLFG